VSLLAHAVCRGEGARLTDAIIALQRWICYSAIQGCGVAQGGYKVWSGPGDRMSLKRGRHGEKAVESSPEVWPGQQQVVRVVRATHH
jgi:hypothetical protein